MVVGILTLKLYLGEASSLKEKRRVLKSLLDKLKARFNISVAEVDTQDAWHFSTIGIALVSNDGVHKDRTLTAVINFIEKLGRAEIIEVQSEEIYL